MMNWTLCLCFSLLTLQCGVSGYGVLFHKLRQKHLQDMMEGWYRDDPPANVTTSYIEQPLDHFDPLVDKTYQQRYHVIDAYWHGADRGPVFLYIGGEGPLDAGEVNSGHHLEMAKKYGALIFGVEHRFYGDSVPKGGLTNENLEHLSSQQALADLASFIGFATSQYHLSDSNVWISIGGSYPGSLSAWMSIKFHHLIYGSLASSAPVRAQVDFQGYNDVVNASLSNSEAGGSAECIGNVTAAFAKVDELITSKQSSQLQKDFNLCQNLTNNLDAETFLSTLQDPFMSSVQYNRGLGNESWIAGVCKEMMATSDPYQNLIKFFNHVQISLNLGCMDVSYETYRKELEQNPIKAWIYQTCTQFGYYQTCEVGSQCPFSHGLDLTRDLTFCKDAFGVSEKSVFQQANFTNDYYGSDKPKGGRILFINGSIDPWHSLSVLESLGENETAIFIDGTSHCQDMGGHGEDMPPALGPALDKIELTVGNWIAEALQKK
ncbi:thymus-specific serine protease-like [Apostichopus japonicus]|uniref:thymus-specific serine protease-like n=1 Tax=Stichopus japonicus TaxID=307972 RepID=UPI003AB8D7C1